MYEARTQPNILKELQQNSNTDASKFEGTFEYDVFASNSIEFAKQEVEREQQYKAAFAQTSWGEYLTMRAAEHGVFRKAAVKAIGKVTVQGTGTVPAGSVFATATGINFIAQAETKVDKQADIEVEAQQAGTAGNVAENLITVIPMSIPGISSVNNAEATHDGFDEETDEDLYERLDFKVKQPATSGNPNQYKEWAMSVEGVGKALIKRLWNGNGTVKVIITDSNNQPASEELQQKVFDYIEEQRPIGATVTVTAPTPISINISLTPLKGGGDIEGIKAAVNEYFLSDTFDGTTVSYAQIGKTILLSPKTLISDYEDLTINGGIENITVTDEQMPIAGEVVLNG